MKIGSYEILDELSLTEHGEVSRTSPTDEPETIFAIKRFGGVVEDPSEPRWELQTFLDRVRVQQALTFGGVGKGPHWAPIYEQGIDGDLAYYVTDYLPLSAKKLIDARVPIKSDDLYAIVTGVIAGLSELKAEKNRAHGNLKPSNVLIGFGNNIAQSPILIADPASNVLAAKSGEAGDIRALAEMIHQLAMHRLPREGEWPFEDYAAWDRLGSRGDRWRRLCCELFDPATPATQPGRTLPALEALRPRAKPPFQQTPRDIGGSGDAHGDRGRDDVDSRSARPARNFATPSGNGSASFTNPPPIPPAAIRWEHDPDLKRLLAELPIEKLRQVDDQKDRLIRWNYYEYVAVADANRVMQAVQDELPRQFSVASRTVKLRGPAARSRVVASGLVFVEVDRRRHAGAQCRCGGGIDRLLATRRNVESGLALTDADWKQFMDRINAINSVHDPVLAALATGLVKSATSQVRLTDSGFAGLPEVKEDRSSAQKMFDAIQKVWPTYIDRENFDREVARAST